MKLTKTAIDAMRYQGAGDARAAKDLRWDDELPGFGVRVWPSGKKTFFVNYRHRGRQRFMSVGRYGVLTLQQARDMAREALVAKTKGLDPLGVREAREKVATFGTLVELYKSRHLKSKEPTTQATVASVLRCHLPQEWAPRRVDDISSEDVAALHAKIGERHRVTANRTLRYVRSMFSLAKTWNLLPKTADNPTDGIAFYPEASRERFVTPEEMPRLAAVLAAQPDPYFRALIWLYLLCAVRKRELLRLKWADVDMVACVVTFKKTKNKKPLVLPLTSHMREVFATIPHAAGNPYVFPGRVPGKHLTEFRRPWVAARKAAAIEDVTVHDLRRTLGSWLASSGQSLPMIGRILNQTSAKATQIYARLQLAPVALALESHGDNLKAVSDAAQLSVAAAGAASEVERRDIESR